MLTKKGISYIDEDGSSVIRWWLFSYGSTDKEILDYLSFKEDVEIDGVQINSQYDCTGKWFSSAVDIKRIGVRVLVTQHAGLDI